MTRDCAIVIPTTDRPGMLRNTLASVRRQTAIMRVSRVIVSENGGGIETSGVCAEFSDLPIEFLFQNVRLGPGEHIAKLLSLAADPYIALVCDDDWWAPGHLEVALRELDLNSDCSAHLSAHIWCDGEVATQMGNQEQELLWVAAGCPFPQSAWRFSPAAVLTLCTLLTPFTFSGLVMRDAGVENVVESLGVVGHSLLLDRAFFPALIKTGPILYEPTVDTYYRVHAGNYTNAKNPGWLMDLRVQGSVEFEHYANESGVDVVSVLGQWYSRLSLAGAQELTRRLLSELGRSRVLALGVPPSLVRRAIVRTQRQRIFRSLRYWQRMGFRGRIK